MRFGQGRLIVAILVFGWLAWNPAVRAGHVADKVQQALDALESSLGDDEDSLQLRSQLKLPTLQEQLDQKLSPDLAALKAVQKALKGDSEAASIAAALNNWIDQVSKSIPADQLATAAQKAKQEFQPIDTSTLQRRRKSVRDAREQLDGLLAGWSEKNRSGWKRYLQWDEFDKQLAAEADPGKAYRFLGGLRKKMRINHKGLERPQFMRLRDQIDQMMGAIYFAHNKQIETEFSTRIDSLAERIDRFSKSPNSEIASEIGQTIGWLEAGGQAPEVVQSVRRYHLRPNLYGKASASLLRAAVEQTVSRTVPINDYILGASVQGTATTEARLSLAMVENPRRAELRLLMGGSAFSNSTAYSGRVSIFTSGTTSIDASKLVYMDDEGLHLQPAIASCYTNSNINGVSARLKLVRKIAYRRAVGSSGQASYIAARRAEGQVAANMDEEAAVQFKNARESFLEKFRKPLMRRGEFPRLMRFSTSKDSLNVKMIQANQSQIAAPDAPPELKEEHDLSVRIHNTMVMNFAEAVFGGREVWDDEMDDAIADFTGKKEDADEGEEESNPWRITFAKQRPITTEFNDQLVTIRLRLEEIGTGENWDEGRKNRKPERRYANKTDVTYVDDDGKKRRILSDDKIYIQAVYRIEKDGEQFKLIRQQQDDTGPDGDEYKVDLLSRFESYDRAIQGGFQAKSLNDRFKKPPTVVRTVISTAFKNSLFKDEIPLEGLELPGNLKDVGKLYVQELTSGGEWLRIGWDRQSQTPDKVALNGE
jgi:hypothetical protein